MNKTASQVMLESMHVSELDMFALGHAINLYVSTTEQIGVAQVTYHAVNGNMSITLPIIFNPNNPTDVDDYAKFVAKMGEIVIDGVSLSDTEMPLPNGFRFRELTIAPDKVRELTAALFDKVGPLGWGSNRVLVLMQMQNNRLILKDGTFVSLQTPSSTRERKRK